MAVTLPTPIFTPQDAQAARQAVRPAADATLADVAGRAAEIKRNPTIASPAPVRPAPADSGRGQSVDLAA